MNNDKLNEIVKRLHGDFFVSCVGPVRSGKSTFINKFMNLKILPYITDDYLKNKILDELPQTSAGKQIMTVLFLSDGCVTGQLSLNLFHQRLLMLTLVILI